MAESKPIKVCLTNKGEDTETPWAHDLGPAPGTAPAGSRVVKLVNVPFMHAKPTWGDTIIVSPAGDDQLLTWDRAGTPWKQIGTRIVDDGGRWAMIVDYAPHTGAEVTEAFGALTRACEGQRVVCEGAWAPREGEPGRAYFAVPKELTAEKLMDILRAATLPLDLIQIHPEPKKPEPVTAAVTGTSKKIKAGAVPVEKLAEPASDADDSPTTRARKAGAKPAPAKAAPRKAAPPKAIAKPVPAKPASKSMPAKSAAKPAPAKAVAAKASSGKVASAKAAPAQAAAKGAPARAAAAKAAPKAKVGTKAPAKPAPAKAKPTAKAPPSKSAKKKK
jgi:hypothetical protein